MGKTLIISAAWTIIIVGVSWCSSYYYAEQAKTEAIVGKACIDAGGSWLRSWGGQGYCERTRK